MPTKPPACDVAEKIASKYKKKIPPDTNLCRAGSHHSKGAVGLPILQPLIPPGSGLTPGYHYQ